jgi:hypothetical protein
VLSSKANIYKQLVPFTTLRCGATPWFSTWENIAMSEQTEAGKHFAAEVVYELLPPIGKNFWRDDMNNGDLIQHFYFFIEGNPDPHRISFQRRSLDYCANPHNINERRRVEEYIKHQVASLSLHSHTI